MSQKYSIKSATFVIVIKVHVPFSTIFPHSLLLWESKMEYFVISLAQRFKIIAIQYCENQTKQQLLFSGELMKG